MLICIYGNPRSGTSLTTKIFKAHGVRTGDAGSTRGYTTYEMNELKQLIKRTSRWSSDECRFHSIRPELYKKVGQEIKGLLRNHKRVAWKSAPDFHQLFERFDPVVITVRRNFESILESQRNGEMWSEAEIEKWAGVIKKRNAMMDAMAAPVVDADQLMAGDFTTIAAALEHCGIEFRQHIAERCIDRGLWHRVA